MKANFLNRIYFPSFAFGMFGYAVPVPTVVLRFLTITYNVTVKIKCSVELHLIIAKGI